MSSSDQAKSKLLDSMRMSKQGSNETPAAVKPAATAPVKKAPTVKAKKAVTAKKSKATGKAAAPKKPVTDNFQAVPRIWPD